MFCFVLNDSSSSIKYKCCKTQQAIAMGVLDKGTQSLIGMLPRYDHIITAKEHVFVFCMSMRLSAKI